jgi:hypothetical protein
VIFKDNISYTIDLIKKEGYKTKIINLDEKELKEWAEQADSLWESMGFKKTGKGEVLGKTCDIWEGMSTKVWVWQNIAMKTETNIFGKMVMEVTKLDLDARSVPINSVSLMVSRWQTKRLWWMLRPSDGYVTK